MGNSGRTKVPLAPIGGADGIPGGVILPEHTKESFKNDLW